MEEYLQGLEGAQCIPPPLADDRCSRAYQSQHRSKPDHKDEIA